MSVKELSTNRNSTTLLLAGYVAIESYFLSLVLGSIVGRFWLSNAVLHILAVFAAYVVMDTVLHRVKGGQRKKAIIAIAVFISTAILAVVFAVLMLYLRKLDMQAAFN